MFHVVLYQPEIPPNTGNIIRLCANTGSALHLIHPLGFEIDDRKLRRAGLDYREFASLRKLRRAGLDYREFASLNEHTSLQDFQETVKPARLWGISTRGVRTYSDISYQPGDAFLFGPETRGLPTEILDKLGPDAVLRLPMTSNSRSLNLSNTAAVVVYEAWRQQGFRM
jgi:tRNA (cytidine/uridine-2'-O-)-methyltransferase